MKKIFLALLLTFLFVGCSVPTWLAKIYMVKAENAFSEGYALRIKKNIPYEERLKYYHVACDNFLKAYRFNPSIFTLYRIELAADSCLRVENQDGVELFRKFEEEYAKKHPKEVKYGDVGPFMNIES